MKIIIINFFIFVFASFYGSIFHSQFYHAWYLQVDLPSFIDTFKRSLGELAYRNAIGITARQARIS